MIAIGMMGEAEKSGYRSRGSLENSAPEPPGTVELDDLTSPSTRIARVHRRTGGGASAICSRRTTRGFGRCPRNRNTRTNVHRARPFTSDPHTAIRLRISSARVTRSGPTSKNPGRPSPRAPATAIDCRSTARPRACCAPRHRSSRFSVTVAPSSAYGRRWWNSRNPRSVHRPDIPTNAHWPPSRFQTSLFTAAGIWRDPASRQAPTPCQLSIVSAALFHFTRRPARRAALARCDVRAA